jgi:hypothetical protein
MLHVLHERGWVTDPWKRISGVDKDHLERRHCRLSSAKRRGFPIERHIWGVAKPIREHALELAICRPKLHNFQVVGRPWRPPFFEVRLAQYTRKICRRAPSLSSVSSHDRLLSGQDGISASFLWKMAGLTLVVPVIVAYFKGQTDDVGGG